MEKIRIDKWLWSVRIFKSRSKATEACKKKRIKITDKALKPSFLVEVGDIIFVTKEGFNLQFVIKKLIGKRVSSPLAIVCYDNITHKDELNKYKHWYIGKGMTERREKGTGRPTKRERRDLDSFKLEDMWDDDLDGR